MNRARLRVVIAIGLLALAGPAVVAAQQLPADAGPTCGNEALTKADGKPWVCTFDEEFDGSDLDRDVWSVQETAGNGYHVGGDCFVDTADNVSVADGALSLTSREEPDEFTCDSPGDPYRTRYTSGMVTTWSSFAQTFGRFAIRARFPVGKAAGLHGALWLWPKDDTRYGAWPASGEIDVAEYYSQYPDRAIPYLHYVSDDPYDLTVTDNYCLVDDPTQFHTYVAEWTRTRITISYDGQTCLDHVIDPKAPLTAPAPFDHPFMVALTQALGLGGNARTASTPLPATTQVDWVRVWS